MYLSRIKINNFRNFSDLDVALDGNIVIVLPRSKIHYYYLFLYETAQIFHPSLFIMQKRVYLGTPLKVI